MKETVSKKTEKNKTRRWYLLKTDGAEIEDKAIYEYTAPRKKSGKY